MHGACWGHILEVVGWLTVHTSRSLIVGDCEVHSPLAAASLPFVSVDPFRFDCFSLRMTGQMPAKTSLASNNGKLGWFFIKQGSLLLAWPLCCWTLPIHRNLLC